jgi:glucose/mannose-6-phosphate isomerase
MRAAISQWPQQFNWKPTVSYSERLSSHPYVIVGGMGGSHLAADLLPLIGSSKPVFVHQNYGLPKLPPQILRNSLFIASSHSGNTEETLDFAHTALRNNYALAGITTGGKLAELLQDNQLPHVMLPNDHIQPRVTLGYGLLALGKLLGENALINDLHALKSFDTQPAQTQANKLASSLYRSVPIIYASERNQALSYIWKITFNETGKIPAFSNVFPELNHNEMTSYDHHRSTRKLSKRYQFIFLRDQADHSQIQQRMDITQKLYEERGFVVHNIQREGSPPEKVFYSLLLASWTALLLADHYRNEPEQVPMVEDLKKLLI